MTPLIDSQPGLSKLLALYQNVIGYYATYRGHTTPEEQTYSGYVYVLEATIEELKQAIKEDEEDRKAFLSGLVDFWNLLLAEWKGESQTEFYQMARITMLENVITNLRDLQSYE